MFKSLCGTKAYENVIIVTTFWSKVSQEEGNKREEQLSSSVFKDILEGDGELVRHDRTRENALDVIGVIYTFTPKTVQVVQEIREKGLQLEATTAGSVRSKELNALIASQKAEIEKVMEELKMVKNSNVALQQDLQDLRQELQKWNSEKEKLKSSFFERGIRLGKDIPIVPNVISVPTFAVAGLTLDGANRLRKAFRNGVRKVGRYLAS